MLEICIYFCSKKIQQLVESLLLLETNKPLFLGEHEKRHKNDVKLNTSSDVASYLTENSVGFFMHSDQCLFNITLNVDDYSTLHVYPEQSVDALWALNVLRAVKNAQPQFGYVSTLEEFKYRNMISIERSEQVVESWVGRGLKKYLPGLYSYTLISFRQMKEKNIRPEILIESAIKSDAYGGEFIILDFFGGVEQWHLYKNKIDALCEATEGIFSKVGIADAAKETKNFLELSALLKKWT